MQILVSKNSTDFLKCKYEVHSVNLVFFFSLTDTPIITVTAVDKDDPETDNAIIRYKIKSQAPQEPIKNMFTINSVSGLISLKAGGLDREVM